jgi:FtsH-binding integral membrane protein
MSVGPIVAGAGLALLGIIDRTSPYVTTVLPGVVVFALGLALTVAPLTSTVLTAGGEEHAGASAAINNTVARVAGLIAVAVIPALAGIAVSAEVGGTSFDDGFTRGMLIAAGVCVAGGVLAAATIQNPSQAEAPHDHCSHCPLDAPPLRVYSGDPSVDAELAVPSG